MAWLSRRRESGVLAMLADQMCRFGADGSTGSPDRVDAMVWTVWAPMLER